MQKKLLILGGTSISRQIVYAAQELGYVVYVTDYNEDSPCKKIADKNFMVSCTDINKIVDLIKSEHIDGVIMGYADVLLPYYVQICQKANLPCYANQEAIKRTTDKSEFKRLCKKFNIPVVDEYTLKEVAENKVAYPIIVKPVDNSGARGIYICKNKTEFDENYSKSLSFSASKHVIIEKYITENEATAFYYLHEGNIHLLGVADRHLYRFGGEQLQLPIGYTFPSKNISDFIKNENKNIVSMFKSLNMKEGMVFLQTFNQNGKYIVYEMGYRLTGSIEQHLMEHEYNFNHVKAILQFAVGDKVETEYLNKINITNCSMANVTLLLKKGIIDHYEGINEVKALPNVLHIHESYQPGQEINDTQIGKLAQVGLRILLYAPNKKELLENMENIKNKLHVISRNGDDMIIKNYSYKDIN